MVKFEHREQVISMNQQPIIQPVAVVEANNPAKPSMPDPQI